MRDIDIAKKIEVFFKGRDVVVALVILILGFIMHNVMENPMSYKPFGSGILKSSTDGKIISVKELNENAYKEVVIEYIEVKKDGSVSDVISIKTDRSVKLGEIIEFEYSKLNKTWAKIKGDTWDSSILIPWAIIAVGIMFLVPAVKEKWLEMALLEKGQITTGQLMLKEKQEKGGYRLEYDFNVGSNNKDEIIKKKIKLAVKEESEIRKSIKILYMEDNTDKKIIVKETYGIDLHKI